MPNSCSHLVPAGLEHLQPQCPFCILWLEPEVAHYPWLDGVAGPAYLPAQKGCLDTDSPTQEENQASSSPGCRYVHLSLVGARLLWAVLTVWGLVWERAEQGFTEGPVSNNPLAFM